MRTNFTRLLRRGLLFSGLAAGSLMLHNCSSKDLEFIDPYEFVNTDFENVEMVSVADPDPVFEDPDLGEVAISEETSALIADILAANSSGDVSATTLAAQALISDFAEELPAEVLAIAENLDAADIAAILDPNTELDPALVDLVALLEQASPELLALLPAIDFGDATEEAQAALKAGLKGKIVVDRENLAPVAQSTLFGPCADAAQEAYDAAVEGVDEQRDENLDLISGNEATRLDDTQTRYDSRVVEHEENYEANVAIIQAETEDLLAASAAAEAFGDAELAADMQLLALIYAVQGRISLQEWDEAALELLALTQQEEAAFVEQLADDRSGEVIANYNDAISEADTLLVNALNNCHNQGAGN